MKKKQLMQRNAKGSRRPARHLASADQLRRETRTSAGRRRTSRRRLGRLGSPKLVTSATVSTK
jgi:hypothetical protein